MAQNVNPTWINTMIDGMIRIVDILIPLVVTLGLLSFFYGIVQFIFSGGDQKARAVGKGFIMYGIIAMFVLVSVLGIVRILSNLFGIPEGGEEIPAGITDIVPF